MLSFVLLFIVKTATTTEYHPVELPLVATEEQKLDDTLQNLSNFYHLPYDRLKSTIQCESRWNSRAYVPWDVTGPAIGLGQFHPDTFYPFAEKLGIENPDLWNPYQQIEVMLYLWSIGQSNRWTCSRMV